jgi:hypothetical protein
MSSFANNGASQLVGTKIVGAVPHNDNAKVRRVGAFAKISSRIAGFKSMIKNPRIGSSALVVST